MLNLKQKLSQSSGNELVPHLPRIFCWQGYVGFFLGFTWNNSRSFHAKWPNCDCYILFRSDFEKKIKEKLKKLASPEKCSCFA